MPLIQSFFEITFNLIYGKTHSVQSFKKYNQSNPIKKTFKAIMKKQSNPILRKHPIQSFKNHWIQSCFKTIQSNLIYNIQWNPEKNQSM